jgi:hypothetical protein
MGLIGFNNIFSSNLNNKLLDSFIEYFDWELLKKGNYFNSSLGEISPNGLDYSELKISSSEHYPSGSAWEAFRSNWVWQSGISPDGFSPPLVGNNNQIPGISGVYVDDIFYPSSSTGDYSHKVDYFNGRVIFDNPISTSSKVQAEFSYKYINVMYASNLPFIREIQYRTLDKSSFFSLNDKGDYATPSEMRTQLPLIAIEIVPTRTLKPAGLGSISPKFINTDILFHCLAEDEFTRNQLIDMISLQADTSIPLLNLDKISSNNAFPINYEGVPLPGALRYPDLISLYCGGSARLLNPRVQGIEMLNSSLYGAVIKITAEVFQ